MKNFKHTKMLKEFYSKHLHMLYTICNYQHNKVKKDINWYIIWETDGLDWILVLSSVGPAKKLLQFLSTIKNTFFIFTKNFVVQCIHCFVPLSCAVLSHLVVSNSLQPCGPLPTRLFCPWDFPGKNTGVGCHFQLQRIFPTQGSNLRLLHLVGWPAYSLPLCHLGVLVIFQATSEFHLPKSF